MLPSWRAWLFSLRCFAAASLALFIAFAADMPRPYWALASVYIASQPLSGATRSKALFRLFGTLLGAAATVALVPNLVDAPGLLVCALAAWVGACLFLSLLDRTPRSYVFLLAGYSAAIIGFPSVTTPGAIFDTAVARVQEIGLGIVCAMVVHSLVFPTAVGPVVAARIAESLRLLERWAARALSGEADAALVHTDRQRIAAVATELDMLDSYLAFDPTQRADAGGTVRLFRFRLLLLIPIVASVRDRVHALRLAGPLSPGLQQLLGAVRAWLRGADADADVAAGGEALRARIDAFQADVGADADWTHILTASLLLRLRDLTQLWQDGRAIERQVREPGSPRPVMRFPTDAQASDARLTDRGMALWSALATAGAILVCCALWIFGAWNDGDVAAEMVAVTCCFFAAQDNPVPYILGFLKMTLVVLVLDAALLFAVLPQVHDFPVLLLALAPPYLLGGVMMATPAVAVAGTALMVVGPTLLSLQSAYTADFPSFVNAGVAAVIGMAIAATVTAITRSVGAEWSTRRMMRRAWSALEMAALRRGQQDRGVFAAQMLDRIAQLMPRLASADAQNDTAAARLLGELRIGLNIVDLRRARHELGEAPRAAIDAMLDRLAAYFRGRTAGEGADPMPLLADIDAALAAVAALPDAAGRRDALLGLVGIRCALLPDAPPYRPAPPSPPTGEAGEREAA
jgi:uncharacterized membrane protein YccC